MPQNSYIAETSQSTQRSELSVLDLRFGDDAVLRRMGEHHLGHPGRVLEQIVEHTPVPADLDHRFAGRAEVFEVCGKSRGGVAVDPRFVELVALRVERARHRVTFVIVDSGIDHGIRQYNTTHLAWQLSRLAAHVT